MSLPDEHSLVEIAREVEARPDSLESALAKVRNPKFIVLCLVKDGFFELYRCLKENVPLAPPPVGFLAGILGLEMVLASAFMTERPRFFHRISRQLAAEIPGLDTRTARFGIPIDAAWLIGQKAFVEYLSYYDQYGSANPYANACVYLCTRLLESHRSEDELAIRFARGEHLLTTERWAEAINDFRACTDGYHAQREKQDVPDWAMREAIALGYLATADVGRGLWKQAVESLNKEIGIQEQLLNTGLADMARARLLPALLARADCLRRLGLFELAVADCGRVIDLTSEASLQLGQARLTRGKSLQGWGKWREALDELDLAAAVFQQLYPGALDRTGAAHLSELHRCRGNLLLSFGRMEEATAAYSKSIESSATLGDPAEFAVRQEPSLPNIVPMGEEAVSPRSLKRVLAACYGNRGAAYIQLLQLDRAIADSTTAIDIMKELEAESREMQSMAFAYTTRGNAFRAMGRPERAFKEYNLAIDRQKRELKRSNQDFAGGEDDLAGAYENRATALLDMGSFFAALLDVENAIDIRGDLVTKKNRTDLIPGLARLYGTHGSIDYRRKKYDRAITYISYAIELYTKAPERETRWDLDRLIAGTHVNRGAVRSALKQHDAAADDYRTATRLYRDVVEKSRAPGCEAELAFALDGLADALVDQGLMAEAATIAEEAAVRLDRLVLSAETELERRTSLARYSRVFSGAVAAFSRLAAQIPNAPASAAGVANYAARPASYAERAAYWAERGRARNLVDFMIVAQRMPAGIMQAEYEAYRKDEHDLADLDFEIGRLEKERRLTLGGSDRDDPGITAQIDASQAKRDKIFRRLNASRAAFVKSDPLWVPGAEAMSVEQLQNVADRSGAALLSLCPGDGGTSLVVALPDGRIEATLLAELTTRRLFEIVLGDESGRTSGWIRAYRRYTRDRNAALWRNQMDSTLAILGRELWQPLQAWLGSLYRPSSNPDNPRPLVLLAGQVLSILPLHAAFWREQNERRWACDSYQISYVPSLWILDQCLDRERPQELEGLLAVRDPTVHVGAPELGTLPGAQYEVDTIRRLFPSNLVLGDVTSEIPATVERVRQELPRWPVALISTHGVYDERAPWSRSGLYTVDSTSADDAPALTLRDIYRMNLSNLQVVVLSACESALTDFRDATGEQLGLPSAFVAAGASTVIGSLWLANDIATAFLIEKFFEEWKLDNTSSQGRGRALWRAQRWLRTRSPAEVAELMKSIPGAKAPKSFEHPAYWSAFSCYGLF